MLHSVCRDRGRMMWQGGCLVPVLRADVILWPHNNSGDSCGEEGQAPGPRIHSTLPPVPTGYGRIHSRI